MRREGALSRSESRPVRQEKGFAEGTRFSGRLCLPDSAGAGAGRMPPLLGRPEGQNEMDVDLKDIDLKDIDLKTLTLKTLTLKARLQGKKARRQGYPLASVYGAG